MMRESSKGHERDEKTLVKEQLGALDCIDTFPESWEAASVDLSLGLQGPVRVPVEGGGFGTIDGTDT